MQMSVSMRTQPVHRHEMSDSRQQHVCGFAITCHNESQQCYTRAACERRLFKFWHISRALILAWRSSSHEQTEPKMRGREHLFRQPPSCAQLCNDRVRRHTRTLIPIHVLIKNIRLLFAHVTHDIEIRFTYYKYFCDKMFSISTTYFMNPKTSYWPNISRKVEEPVVQIRS